MESFFSMLSVSVKESLRAELLCQQRIDYYFGPNVVAALFAEGQLCNRIM